MATQPPEPKPIQTPPPAPAQVQPAGSTTTPPEQAPPEEQEQLLGPRVNFWQTPLALKILPFATSFILHAGIIILGVVTYKVIEIATAPHQEQIIIPDATIIDAANPGGLTNPGLGDDPNRPTAQDEFQDVQAREDAWNNRPTDSLTNEMMGGGETRSSALIARGVQNLGTGDLTGSGTGDGGALSRFGVPGGGGQGVGPPSDFFGMGGNAHKIIYLCDATGRMIDRIDLLRMELRRSVGQLQPDQAFNVIFFHQGDAVAVDRNRLIVANTGNKRRASEFVDQTVPGGFTNLIPAIEKAFAQQPELIYFLTHGEFDHRFSLSSNEEVLQAIRRLNADKKVVINTIAFLDLNDATEQWLRQLAEENGGNFKFVSWQDVGR